MKIFFYDPTKLAIFAMDTEQPGSAPQLIAEEVPEEYGKLFAAAPQLLGSALKAEFAFEWMLGHINLATLPDELQPLRLHLEHVRQSIAMAK